MGIYTEAIRKKEENNRTLETYADTALKNDKSMYRLENEVDDAQSALMYVLDMFKLSVPRVYGCRSIEALLESVLDPLGMMYRYAEQASDVIKDRTEYIIAFREDGKAVALTPSWRGYRWYCPHDNKEGYASREYIRKLRKGCYILNQPLVEQPTIVATFIYNVLKYLTVYDFIKLFVASGLVSGLGLILPYFSRWIYNVYLKQPAGTTYSIRLVFALFLTVNLVRGFITIVKSKVLSDVKHRVSIKIQAAIMAKVLHLPRSFFTENSSGKLSKRISNCTSLSGMIINIFMDILLNFSFSTVYVIQMRNISPKLFAPALLFIGLKIIVSIIGAVGSAVIDRKTMAVEMDNNSFFYSVIKGIQKIKGMGAEKSVYARWADNYRTILHYNYNQPFFLRYQGVILTMLTTGATIALMGTAAFNDITREEYMIFSTSYSMVVSVASTLTSVMSTIFRMKTLSDNVKPIFESDNEQSKSLEYVRSLKGNIRVDNVFFTYDEGQRGCLRGVSLDIKAGDKLAIVGESGCGKSTLLKCIMGMENPSSGAILFDDKDIELVNQKSLRQRIGSVFQFSKLFPGTIASNVAFGSSVEVSDEEIWDALDKACIGDYVRSLPLGINTEISESNSSGFSGGQRQRLLIARALVSKPKVLILDEATSALDNLTQKQVLEEVNKLSCTVLMVAHRLTTVMDFDRIVMLENGEIAESGNYKELMELNGKFAELVRKQLVEDAEEEARKKSGREVVLTAE